MKDYYGGNWPATSADHVKVLRDGEEVFTGTANEAFVYILKKQSRSVLHACKYGGWRVEDVI